MTAKDNDTSLSSMIEVEKLEEKQTMPAGGLAARIEKNKAARRKSYTLDLRIHSPASLGYFKVKELDTAPALVRLAKVKGLDVIAITDFFSGAFIDKIAEAAKGSPLTVLPGVNLRCSIPPCRDVVLTCLFPEGTPGSRVSDFLAALQVPAHASEQGNFSLDLPFETIIETIEAFGAIAFPSRMDKTPQQMHVVPQLVEKYGFRAFDLAYGESSDFFKKRWPKTKFRFFSFSNAKALAQVGSRTARVKLQLPGFAGIRELVARSFE